MRSVRRWMLVGIVLASIAAALTLAAEKESKAPAAKDGKVAAETAKKADPFAVPDGSPEELIKFLETLSQARPEKPSAEDAKEFNAKAGAAAWKAAEKILAAKPTEQQAAIAVQVKLEVLTMQQATGDEKAGEKLRNLPGELEKAGWPKLARLARAEVLQHDLSQSANVEELKKRLEEVKRFIGEATLGNAEGRLVMAAVRVAEETGETDLAVAANRDFGKILAASSVEQIARMGKRLEGAARRLGLVGKEMPIEGTKLDGKALDWAQYRGKVVLVSFWATWCGPCRQEIKTIRKNYDAYHDRGFDVVAVSLDEERDQLEEFVKDQKLPWTVVYDHALDGEKDDRSMAMRYGISGIPELILVGKDGNVVALNPRGPSLGSELEKLLGPAEKEEKKAKDEKKAEPK